MDDGLERLRADHYVPDEVPDRDLKHFTVQQGQSRKIGWGDKPAILIVDMTRRFTEERKEVGRPCVEANERLLEHARSSGLQVIFTKPIDRSEFPAGYRGTTKGVSGRGGGTPSKKRERTSIAPGLDSRENDMILEKPRASAFFDTHLSNMLHYYGIDTLVVTGMSTSGCVRATVVDGHSSNFRVIVPKECVADRSVISHELSLFDMSMKYADVVSLDEVIQKIESDLVPPMN